MKLTNPTQLLSLFIAPLLFFSACKSTQWAGQAPIQKVSTLTVPIQKQVKGIFDLGEGVYVSNQFEGARLNGIARTGEQEITALITPENTPINPSPWYAFKVWADAKQKIRVKITYLQGSFHRYPTKLSSDGLTWIPVPESQYQPVVIPDPNNGRNLPTSVSLDVQLGPDTLWIAAQELQTSTNNSAWIDSLGQLPFIETFEIGKSREGRPLRMMKIGHADDSKMNIVVSRQHPPEVTGYLAMKAFVEALCENTETGIAFRSMYNTYIIPMANPDGVDNGHWRHGAGGIDLNRDWGDFNQPETSAIRKFMKDKVTATGGKFYFGVDFHSTWEDIYYTIDPEAKGNMPGLVPEMIKESTQGIADYEPNIRPGLSGGLVISSSKYFFHEFGAESLTYEVGDNTPRSLVKLKGERTAQALMNLMIQR